MHCVMHKCIMVKVGGKRKTRKVAYVNKTRKFNEIRGKIYQSRGSGAFGEIGGNVSL